MNRDRKKKARRSLNYQLLASKVKHKFTNCYETGTQVGARSDVNKFFCRS